MTAQFNTQSHLELSNATPVEPLDILGLLRAVWQGKWVIAAATLMCVVLAGYYGISFGARSLTLFAAKTQFVGLLSDSCNL